MLDNKSNCTTSDGKQNSGYPMKHSKTIFKPVFVTGLFTDSLRERFYCYRLFFSRIFKMNESCVNPL